jgi:hypothetical protein
MILVCSEKFTFHSAKFIKYCIVLHPLQYSIFLCFFLTFCLWIPQLFSWGFLLFCHNCGICRTWTVIVIKGWKSVNFIIPSIYILENSNSIYGNRGCGMMLLTFKMPVFSLVPQDISLCGCVWIAAESLWLNKKSHHLHRSDRMTATVMASELGIVSTHFIFKNSRHTHIRRL